MMRGVLAFALLVVAAPVAKADLTYIGGVYDVAGVSPDGSPYVGEVVIDYVSDTTCDITWMIEGVAVSFGICMRVGTTFAASYSSGDAVGLAIYEVLPDGNLDGVWTVAGQDGAGSEFLTSLHFP